ncbi:MAG: hypothetical protein J5822_06985 [Eubacteriaceae bacterium]|nr:hypothetical protein [Eubacteriaceae bacterium]
MRKLRRLLTEIIAFACVFMILVNVIPAAGAAGVNTFNQPGELQIITDIDDGSFIPADTMFSFNSAAGFGCMKYSVSLIMTFDGVLIVARENDLSYYSLAQGKITDHTIWEIDRLNFAYNYTTDGGESYPFRNQMHPCVTFEALLKSYPYCSFIINIVQTGDKGIEAAEKVCEMIREASLEQDCVILGSDEVIDCVRENKNVHILTCPRQGEENIFRTLSGVYLSNLVFKIGYGMIIIPYEELDDWSSHDMAALMARNVAVYVSGVNGQEAFMAVKDLPVSGIITANPQLMFELRAVTDTTEI